MRFFHLSDLHIGKQLHHYNMKEDQQWILKEIISYAEQLKPDAILIAGDVYDKSNPSAEAVGMLDEFLTNLSELNPQVPVLLISGNHDSAQRLDYAQNILKKSNIYIAGKLPEQENEFLRKVTLRDEYGEVDFYLLPFLKPGFVRDVAENTGSYDAAVGAMIERENIDHTKRNVLLSHQFYIGSSESPETCDSEMISVGGIDQVNITQVEQFDYVALGHLHGAQRVGKEWIRYCGTPLKYSVSEAGHQKALHVITLKEKGSEVLVEKYPFHPLRDVRKVKGELKDILAHATEENTDDYVSVTLTDEVDPYKPKEQLEEVYSHILEVRIDNTRTRTMLEDIEECVKLADPLQLFADFYKEIQGRDPDEAENQIIEHVFHEVMEEKE